MSDNPFFTIGIPTFNRADLLREAISGALNQTFTDFELIISDNHSEDHTPQVVDSFKDKRLRYIRHDRNRGLQANFDFLLEEAQGTFFIINQDDDLILPSFLLNCHRAVAGNNDIVMYAAALWRGNPARGYRSELLVPPNQQTTAFFLNNEPLVLDGSRMVVALMHSFPFVHPSIALKTSTLRDIGGFFWDIDIGSDVITEARVMCQGKLVYDPRVGAMYREHGLNFSGGINKTMRHLAYGKMYQNLIKELENCSVDWRRCLNEDLDQYDTGDLLRLLKKWVRSDSPPGMIKIGWQKLKGKNSRTAFWLYNKLFRRLGVGGIRRLIRTLS